MRRVFLSIFMVLGLMGLITWISSYPKAESQSEEVIMKVNFYKYDFKSPEKEKYFVGTAQIKGSKLEINVQEPELEKLLKNPFRTITGRKVKTKHIDYILTYQPGTPEHLRGVALNCFKYGYLGEIVKDITKEK